MKYLYILLLSLISSISIAQNPLKKEIQGNTTVAHESKSQFVFTNSSDKSVFISDVIDNRSSNWNKQINDSIRVDLIRDFWSLPYKTVLKNKITNDFKISSIKTDSEAKAGSYKIEPTVDIHFPNFISSPTKGYKVLTRIKMNVSKDNKEVFTKTYQEYSFFTSGSMDYKEDYNSKYIDGTNIAMWSSMKRVLDQFYIDLNEAFVGKKIEPNSSSFQLANTSNITNDPNLTGKQVAFSDAKDKGSAEGAQANYKLEKSPDLPPLSDKKLDDAIGALKSTAADSAKKIAIASAEKELEKRKQELKEKKEKQLASNKPKTIIPVSDSAKKAEDLAIKKLREMAIDSVLNAEKANKLAKAKEKEEKEKALLAIEKTQKDSLIKANKVIIAEKIRLKNIDDSIKLASVNKKVDIAKKKIEAEKDRVKPKEIVKKTEEVKVPILAKEKAVTKKPEQDFTINTSSRRPSKTMTGKENISEEIRRIAREIEDEENNKGNKFKPEVAKPTEIAKKETKIEKEIAKVEESPKSENLKSNRKAKLDSLLALRKAKLEAFNKEKEIAINSKEKTKEEITEKVIAEVKEKTVKPLEVTKSIEVKAPIVVDEKKYIADSIKLALEKQKRVAAILAAQKMAQEAERNALLKNPQAGELFALVSSDPPSKLEDKRTSEERKADRIFVPKSESSSQLLSRVKMITPQEEEKLLAMMKGGDVATIDSFFISQQKNRPIPNYSDSTKTIAKVEPIKDTIKKEETKKLDTTNKKSKKEAIIDNKLKEAKEKVQRLKDSLAASKVKKDLPKLDSTKSLKTTSPAVKFPDLKTKTPAAIKDTVAKELSKKTAPTTPTKPAANSSIPPAKTETPPAKTEASKTETSAAKADQKIKELDSIINKKKEELKSKVKSLW